MSKDEWRGTLKISFKLNSLLFALLCFAKKKEFSLNLFVKPNTSKEEAKNQQFPSPLTASVDEDSGKSSQFISLNEKSNKENCCKTNSLKSPSPLPEQEAEQKS